MTCIFSERRFIILLSEFSSLNWITIYFSETRSPSDNRIISENHRLISYTWSDHRIRVPGVIISIINICMALSNVNIVSVKGWWLWIFCMGDDEYVLYPFIFHIQNILSTTINIILISARNYYPKRWINDMKLSLMENPIQELKMEIAEYFSIIYIISLTWRLLKSMDMISMNRFELGIFFWSPNEDWLFIRIRSLVLSNTYVSREFDLISDHRYVYSNKSIQRYMKNVKIRKYSF